MLSEINVYYGNCTSLYREEWWEILTDSELSKIEKIKNIEDQQKAVTIRAILRIKLADFVNSFPQDLEFESGVNGKPYLKDYPQIHFSLSHTEDIFVLAICRDHQIGIDIENTNREVDIEKMSTLMFSEDDLALFKKEKLVRNPFFIAWTCKEAVLKALGGGLHLGMQHVKVRFQNDEAKLIAIHGLKNESWSLFSYEVFETFRIAVACNEARVTINWNLLMDANEITKFNEPHEIILT